MIAPQEMFLLAVAAGIPVWLLMKRRDDLLVRWICLTVAIDAIGAHVIVNLPAARVAGLMVLPSSFIALSRIRESRAGRALWWYVIWLGILGIVFGFLMPWPTEGLDRLPTQTAEGRAVIYFVRRVADISLGVYLARYLWKTRRPRRFISWFIGGTTIAAIGGIAQWATGCDLYALLTGTPELGLDYRMRGLNYEPRGLGLITGQGLLVCLALWGRQRSWKWLALVGIHALGLFVSVSTSGLFVVAAGLVPLLALDAAIRKSVIVICAMILALWGAWSYIAPRNDFADSWSENVGLRLAAEKTGTAPQTKLEELALHLDIFDAAAFMFLASRPLMLLTGAGPGMSGLASTDYLPSADLFRWVDAEGAGINTVPHMGILRELCDAGLVGLSLLVIFLAASGRALRTLSTPKRERAADWQLARVVFWVMTAIYFVQGSPLSGAPSIFLAIGLAATWLAPVPSAAATAKIGGALRPAILGGQL